MLFYPPQIPRGLFWDEAGTFMVGCWRLSNLRHDRAQHIILTATDMVMKLAELHETVRFIPDLSQRT
jgi:hypothetical protein